MATKKFPVVHVAVVGLPSSSFPGTSGQGAGKSVLCNRFVRPKRDDLCLNHSCIMTNSDFGSSVVNNDHYLYWGEKIAALEDGSVSFQIVEHTEFVEDGNLQLYSIVKPYHKRCIQQKLVSGGKMQYIHPDQLAVPDEFSNVARFPDKFIVDGYIICIDVSDDELPEAQSTQREFLGRLLPAIMGVKKAHIVVALTKFDIAKEKSIAAANEILSKCKRQPTVIEVSALEGVNVDGCFLVLAHLVDSRRPRTRILAFSVAHANLKERVRRNEESFQGLLSGRITDFSLPLPVARKSLENEVEFQLLRELKGIDRVDRLIRAQLKYLKEGIIKSKRTDFLDHLRASLELFLVNLSLEDTPETCVEMIRRHEKFSAYFTENAEWRDDAQFLKLEQTTQVPFSLLGEKEGLKLLQERIDVILAPLREQAACNKISSALQTASNLIPGSSMEDVLKELGVADQLQLISRTKAHHIFQEGMALVEQECVADIIELLLEHPSLFTLSEEVALATVHEQLKDDRRYQRLEWVEQRRTSAIIKHIGVMKWPDKGPFAVSPILDAQSLLKYGAPSQEDLARRHSLLDHTDSDTSSSQSDCWSLDQKNRSFCLAILGRTSDNALTLRSDFMNHMSGSGECEVREVKYQMELTVHHGPITSLQSSTSSSQPQGAVVVVNSEKCLLWLEKVLESLWIPRGDTPTPYRGLPLVILALDDSIPDIPSQTVVPDTPLCRRAKELANAVQCVLVTERPTVQPKRLVLTSVISPLLSSLLDSVTSYTEFLSGRLMYNPKALNVAVFTLAEDPYSPKEFLSPWLHHQAVCSDGTTLFINCPLERQHSIVHLSFHSSLNILEIKSKVFAGFLCGYSPHRPASIAILRHLLSQLPNIPVLIIAMVTDPSCGDHVTDEGRRLAEQHGAYFLASNSPEWVGCTTDFFSKCWFSRFSSWQTQNFNPRGNRDRPLPQPMTTSHSSMHDLTSSSRDEMSSSLPAPPGPAPPPPHPDSARPISPSRPHSIVGFLSDTSLPPRLLSPPPPPPLTSPPSFTSSLPRPPKNKAGKKAMPQEEQIYSDPVEMVMDSQQKKATLQRRQERGATLPRTPGGTTPLSPDHAVLLHLQQSASKLEGDTSYADPKDIIKILPNSGDLSRHDGPFLQSPEMSPPPPPASPPLMNGGGASTGEADDLYDIVQPTKKAPPMVQQKQQPSPKTMEKYDRLTRQTSKKYDHLTQAEGEGAPPPGGPESGELGKWYITNSPPSERPPPPLPESSTGVPQPEPLEYFTIPSSLPQQELPEYATVGSERKARNKTPHPRNSGGNRDPPADPPAELYAVVDKTRKSKKPLTVPVARGNGRYADEGKSPPIPSPPGIACGSNASPPGDHLYAAIVPKRARTPPPVLPKPVANGRGSPPDATARRTLDRPRKSSKPLVVGGAPRANGPAHPVSYGSRTRSTEGLNVVQSVESPPQHYVPENTGSQDLYALPAPRKKRPPVAPKPLPRRSPSPIPPGGTRGPLQEGSGSSSFFRSLPPRGKSFDLDDRGSVGGVSPTHRWVGSPQLDRVRAAGAVPLPLPDKHVLDHRLRTTSDPFRQFPLPHQINMVVPGYGKRVESSEDVWRGSGRGWRGGGEEEEEERPEEPLPERRYTPTEMGLEEKPPPLPPRNYDWSDVEDNDEDLFQSEDELEEPCFRISLDEQQAMYSSLRLYQKKTNSMSGIEELYAIVNQVAREQEATQATNKDHLPPPMENEVTNVYDTLESALKQKEQLKVRSEVTAAMTPGSPGAGPGPQSPPTASALGTLAGVGKAVFTPKQLKLIKQQQKLLDKLQKKTEREAERRRRSETRRKRREDKKGKKNKSVKEPEKQRYFGSPLEKVVEADGVPRFLKQCTQIIEEKGLKTEGIYRVSGKKDVCLELQDQYDMDINMDIAALGLCETTITSTLKAFFKLLPDPLIPNPVASAVLDINVEGPSEQKAKLEGILQQMPTPNLCTLRYLIFHLHKIQLSQDVNKMSSSNLAIVFWPTLMRPPLADLADPSKQLAWQLTMARLIEHPAIVPEVC